VAEAEHRAEFPRVSNTFGTELSHQTGETSGFAAPDRSGCALSGERFVISPRRRRDVLPWGKSRTSKADRPCIHLHGLRRRAWSRPGSNGVTEFLC